MVKIKVLETCKPILNNKKNNNFFKRLLNFIIKLLRLDKKSIENTKYLIERYYKHDDHTEYLICENYNFNNNTYSDGVISFKLPHAYQVFNTFVKNGNFNIVTEECEDEQLEGND